MYGYCHNCVINCTDQDGRWGTNIILSFMQDDYAKQIVSHWIDGAGKRLDIIDDSNWDAYMTANPEMTRQILDAAAEAFSLGEMTFSVENGSIALSASGNGGYTTGYDVLNGSNLYKGGFSFRGQITGNADDGYTISGRYQFNDRVDPNEKYLDDIILERAVRLFLNSGKGVDYDLRIEGQFEYHVNSLRKPNYTY